jgi:uncharacterized membrane protein
MSHNKKQHELTTQRIEAFSDGVFAIAITLLVLEIRVPHVLEAGGATTEPASLAAALLDLWPSYFGYVFSFVMIGIYWANHHYIFSLYQRTDHYFVLLNVLFLMFISFVPFPTAVLAEYIDEPAQRQTAITLYTFGLFLPAFAWLLMWLYASRGHHLIDRDLDPQFIRRLTLQFLLSNLFYLTAFVLSLWSGIIGMLMCVGLSAVYLLPRPKPRYRSAEATAD